MFYHIATRWLSALVFLIGVAASGMPVWAQHHGHGGHGGHHYGGHSFGHGFGGFGHHGFGHHYSPFYYGGYYGLGYGSYGYNSWPQSYTPRVYSYSGPPTVYVAPPTAGTPNSYGATSPPIDATATGLSYKSRAESAFRTHHYEEAVDWAKRAAKEMPRNGRAFLLLSQIHLAVGEYRDAAGAARLGMSLLPIEDWGYVVKNFRSYYHDADYVAQVRRLERFIAENPEHADSRFLLGYHWVFLGHPNAANRELTKAAELNPRDEWATRLLEVVDGPVPQPRPAPSESVRGTTGGSGSSRSVDASVEYPPPQEFDKPLQPGGPGAADHKHHEEKK
jgi:tetratricopeptide (TPR) repeat protein